MENILKEGSENLLFKRTISDADKFLIEDTTSKITIEGFDRSYPFKIVKAIEDSTWNQYENDLFDRAYARHIDCLDVENLDIIQGDNVYSGLNGYLFTAMEHIEGSEDPNIVLIYFPLWKGTTVINAIIYRFKFDAFFNCMKEFTEGGLMKAEVVELYRVLDKAVESFSYTDFLSVLSLVKDCPGLENPDEIFDQWIYG